jgi:hypothetical protein
MRPGVRTSGATGLTTTLAKKDNAVKMKLTLIGMLLLLPGLSAHALTGACGHRPIPVDKERKARDFQLVCGGGTSVFTRFPAKFNVDQWTKLERLGKRDEMQALRLAEPKISWSGKIPFTTYETWTWTSYHYGQNAARCGTHQEPYSCQVPVYKKKCVTVSDSPSPRSDRGGYGSSSGSKPAPYIPKAERASSMPTSRRQPQSESCYDEQVGTRTSTCYNTVANVCAWEENHDEIRACSEETLAYSAEFSKPDANWSPEKDANYLDVLPNKYDLMPGEHEQISIISNFGRTSLMVPSVDIDNAWNKYQVSIDQPRLRCEMNTTQAIRIEIKTEGRIKRKSPNAFAFPVDKQGNPRQAISRNEIGIKGGFALGQPYNIRLQDTSNKMILAAARQSRKFADKLDEGAKEEIVSQQGDVGTAVTNGFWKDTQFRVRLYQRDFAARDIRFSDNLYTNSGTVQAEGDDVVIPLEGENGVQSLYRASGPMNEILGKFWSMTDVKLTPGKDYQLRISMYQRGLPFYDSKCSKSDNCESDKAKDSAFSDELVIDFKADNRFDDRSLGQKFIDWQRRPLWEKFTNLF